MIRLQNVRTNNLKGVSIELDPHGFTVLCGVSGSGKSSLAFDTLYAEGQRRYLETLSPAARAALDRFPPVEADRVEGLPPAIALRQDEDPGDRFSTVGTATDLHDLLAGVFAGAGVPHCPECGATMRAYEPADVAAVVADMPEGTRVLVGFPAGHLGETVPRIAEAMAAARLARMVVGGEVVRVEEAAGSGGEVFGGEVFGGEVFGVIDRVTAGRTDAARVAESADTALAAGAGTLVLMTESDGRWSPTAYSDRPACPHGHGEVPPPAAEDLSFRSPRGACPACKGTGDCVACNGTRLNPLARGVALGRSFGETLAGRLDAVDLPPLPGQFRYAAEAVERRVSLLTRVGLGHLSLSRSLDTLSAGERQRVRLASVLAADAVETLIVLDEPLGGLHADDVPPVAEAIRELHAAGNGVVAVDHTFALLPLAGRVIELGPGAGSAGGEVVFDGLSSDLREADTATGRAIRETFEPPPRPAASPGSLAFRGVSFRAVDALDFDVPLERLTVVTGRSGAGKTSLLLAAEAVARRALGLDADARPRGGVEGAEVLGEVQLVPAAPPARTGRSCVATHTKAMDEVRKLLASVPEAAARGLTAKHFSFNAAGGGRCRLCQGRGEVDVPMAHLADLRMTCPQCGGGRFEPGIADVRFRRRSVVDMLAMTVSEAVSFFRTEPAIRKRLQPVRDVGLGYVTLGQPLGTLSGGEAQRLHLASHLVPTARGRVLFLLDEPARGLHPADVATLLSAISLLLDVGHTVLAAEHDLRFLAAAETVVPL